ncbi:MAG: hypothetical protein HRT35_26985 [Algicola sp.]|nr:hypothetical protein [Algicola sp.]
MQEPHNSTAQNLTNSLPEPPIKHGDDQAFPTLPLDPDLYRAHLAGLDVTDEQANEFLQTLWTIMHTMVDIGMGLDTVQLFIPPNAEKPMIEQEIDLQPNQGASDFNTASLSHKKKG